MQGERGVPVFEPVVHRLGELQLLAVSAGVGKVVVLLQGIDIGLGERGQFLARVLALFGMGDALQRIG